MLEFGVAMKKKNCEKTTKEIQTMIKRREMSMIQWEIVWIVESSPNKNGIACAVIV